LVEHEHLELIARPDAVLGLLFRRHGLLLRIFDRRAAAAAAAGAAEHEHI
jgi:hypothetical protein